MGWGGVGWVAYGILVSDPVPIGLWILTALGLALGLGLGILDLGLGLDNNCILGCSKCSVKVYLTSQPLTPQDWLILSQIDSFLFISSSQFQEGRSTYQPQETNSIRGFSLRGPSETIREGHQKVCHVIKSPSTQQFSPFFKFATNYKSYLNRIFCIFSQ